MELLHLTEDNFEDTIKKADCPVVVDFWAPWCGPCKMLGPVFEGVAKQIQEGKAIFAKVCVDDAPALSRTYSVMSIPTIIIFSAGKEAERSVGYVDEEELKRLVAKFGVKDES